MIIQKIQNFWQTYISKKLDTFNLIEISKSAILHNYDYFQSIQPNCQIWPVLKSNAYGHGLTQVAQILKQREFAYIVVDSYYEALKVWQVSSQPVLLIGQSPNSNYKNFDFSRLAVVVYRLETIETLSSLDKHIKIHLKINTGLNRQGIRVDEVADFLKELKKYPKLELEGVCSHLASSDDEDKNTITFNQKELFLQAIKIIKENVFTPKYFHLANTGGTIRLEDNNIFNAVRLGLGLYGISPLAPQDTKSSLLEELKPALTFWSQIIHTIELEKGDEVSYGGTFVADKKMTIGLLPVGYYEVFTRKMSNKGCVSFEGKYLPLVGNICMNLSLCNIDGQNIKVGDRVQVISPEPSAKNSIYEIAKLNQTIPYEILVKIAESIRRVVVD